MSSPVIESADPSAVRPLSRRMPISPVRRAPWPRQIRRWVLAGLVLTAFTWIGWWAATQARKLPRASELFSPAVSTNDDWCEEHSVPESICVACEIDGTPVKGHGWCRVHGVADCPFEHADVIQLPTATPATPQRLQAVAEALELRPREANNSRCLTHLKRIQVEGTNALDRLGIELQPAAQGQVVETLSVTGEVTFNQNHIAHLSSRVPGTIWRVERRLGDHVAVGELLLLIDSLEVGATKNELLKALGEVRLKRRIHDRLASLASRGSAPGRQVQEAEAAVQEADIALLAAQQSLVNLGLPVPMDQFAEDDLEQAARRIRHLGIPADVAAELDRQTANANLIPIRAPLEGVLVEMHAVAGEVVDPQRRLCTVADRNRLWVTVQVPQHEARALRLGQTLRFQPDGNQRRLTGSLDWIADSIDRHTRMLPARAEVQLTGEPVKSGSFGTGEIILREDSQAVLVPQAAVHWEGCCHVVFVRQRDFEEADVPRMFGVRKVRLGMRTGDRCEILAGIWPGELVATAGSEALRVELLKGNLGAGCGCAH